MKDVIGDYDPDRVKFLICQDVEDEIEAGTAIVKELCDYAAKSHREPCDASLLTIGLKCGGSDGFSGITANPLVGGNFEPSHRCRRHVDPDGKCRKCSALKPCS